MKIFITGIAGFLGANLADYYIKKKFKVSGCDNLIGGSLENIDTKKINFFKANCENLDEMSKIIKVGYGKVRPIKLGSNLPLVFIGGPCAIESRDHAFSMAKKIKKICNKVGIEFIYKSCYNKDSRSSSSSFHGVGIDEGLRILEDLRKEFEIPVISDFSDHVQGTGGADKN